MAHLRHFERDIVEEDQSDLVALEARSSALLAAQIVDYALGVVEVLLGLRFVLKLFTANPTSGFVSFVYSLTDPLMAPFRTVFHQTVEQGAVFEWSVLVAMAVYALGAWAIIRLIEISTATTIDDS